MATDNAPINRDFSNENGVTNGNHKPVNDDEDALQRIRTSGSVVITAELFEKLYLQPQLKGGQHPLQKILGNPTPL